MFFLFSFLLRVYIFRVYHSKHMSACIITEKIWQTGKEGVRIQDVGHKQSGPAGLPPSAIVRSQRKERIEWSRTYFFAHSHSLTLTPSSLLYLMLAINSMHAATTARYEYVHVHGRRYLRRGFEEAKEEEEESKH